MVKGLIGIKRGMTQLFVENNRSVPVTVIEVGPCRVLHVKTPEKDGYEAVQLGFGENNRKNLRRDVAARFKKLGLAPMRHLKEFPIDEAGSYPELKQELTCKEFEGEGRVKVQGTSKGKGFQGVFRRHGFHGGRRTHGSMFHRAPGSIGCNSWPSEVPKGRKMPGHQGAETVTTRNLEVVRVDADRNLVFVKGSVPGPRNGLVYVYKMQ